jgi:NAD(P)-dependent dehydrogenase (short-subunit alcohol dehydrogenase family)
VVRDVLVTGGASGIGLGIAEAYAATGHPVILADIDGSRAEEEAARLRGGGAEARSLTLNVADRRSVEAALASIEPSLGGLFALVNSAGVDLPKPLEALDEAHYDKVMDIDLKGIYLMTRAALPLLERAGGSVVNIASVMAWYTAAGYVAYTAAKAGVLGMTRALAVELGSRGVRVNAICPGFIDTPIWQRNLTAMGAEGERFAQRIAALHPVGRRGRPADVAHASLWLTQPDSAFITGSTLVVDGGVSLRLVAPHE